MAEAFDEIWRRIRWCITAIRWSIYHQHWERGVEIADSEWGIF